MFNRAFIPYGCYWRTPFVRWQGSFQDQHAIRFAAEIGRRFLREKEIDAGQFDELILGITVPQTSVFYGGPWLAGLLGAAHMTGPMVAQACATGAKTVALAAQSLDTGLNECVLSVCTDRCSNGPHLVYPSPQSPGGTVEAESWVLDNFGKDPFARNAMIDTAENVARTEKITKEEQDELTVIRYRQYTDSTKNDREFQKRYMIAPIEVKDRRGRKTLATVEGDEGVFPTTMEGLARLRPVKPEGTVSFGTQTYPADGNCGMVIAGVEKARELSRDAGIIIRIISFGQGRAEKGFMAKAIVPAARMALEKADITMDDVKVTKTHTPFAVNDVYFCREMGIDWKDMNKYGCSLIYGHPQGPTGLRLIIELIEELVLLGGGYGLFDGCAAGDTAAALVLKVDVK